MAVTALIIGTPTGTSDIVELGDRLRVLLEDGDGPLICDVGALRRADCGTIDSLARLQLTARRLGCEVELRHVSSELHRLLAFAGLCEVVGCTR